MYGGKIAENIADDTYIKLINYIHKTCDVVRISLIYPRRRNTSANKLYMEKIEKNKQFLEDNFSYLFLTDKERRTENYFCKLYYMRVNSEIKKYLLSNLDLFNWKIIQDLAFFRNGYCFLDSISHEKLCWIYCDTLEEFEILKKMGIQFVGKFYKVDKEEQLINKKHYYLMKNE